MTPKEKTKEISLSLLDNILKEEMSAEMRTWLMELRLLIGNDH